MKESGRRSARPAADAMAAHAAAFVAHATRRNALPLDYSVASLRVVDFVVSGLRKNGPDPEHAASALFGIGAYVGEVLVRRAGAVWVDFDATQRAYFSQSVGVRMPDGRVWNPLGKVLNRFELGPEESLQTFYLTLHGRSRR
nr:hypothetical protein [Streptomyces boluensis]